MSQNCIFCGETLKGNRSKEHVYPSWLQRELGITSDMLLQTHFSENGEVISDRMNTIRKHLFGNVCLKCNNGWMSQLENKSKDLITKLAENPIRINNLNKEQRLILSRWACKTAYMIHFSSNYRKIVPIKHCNRLFLAEDKIPGGVSVIVAVHSYSEPFAWWQSTQWLLTVDEHQYLTEEFLENVRNIAYKIVFSIKNLVILVVFNPFENMRLLLIKDLHIPVTMDKNSEYLFINIDNINEFKTEDDTHKMCIHTIGSIRLVDKSLSKSEILLSAR